MSQDSETSQRAAGHVFLSYARQDRERAKPIVEALEARGRRVWWDRHLAGGSAFAREIETALRSAEAVVVVWSRTSVESDWVRDEAALGRDLGRLVPITLDNVAAPLGFGQFQTVDLSGWNGRPDAPEIDQVLHALDADARSGFRPPGAPAIASQFRPLRRSLLIGGALGAPLAAIGAWWLGGGKFFGGPKAPPNSIAVLPFANLSGDASQDYFSDGLTEELIGALARLPSLQVAGRTSSFKFKTSRDGSVEIGAKLGVAYLLDGSVRRQGDQVRISAELVDARAGFERWSHSYDLELKDILATQGSIAEAVAQQLKVAVLGGEIASLEVGGTTNPAAYDAYLQGRRVFALSGDEKDYRAALANLDSAIAADPRFAAAYSTRARVQLTIGDDFAGPQAHQRLFDEALASARQAVVLAPGLADAQATLADTLATTLLDFAGARQAYARAMATGGGQATVLGRFGLFSCDVGDLAAGLAALQRAADLDPLNPYMFVALGRGLVIARRYAEGVAATRQALALSPALNGAHVTIGDALFYQGDLKGAAGEYALEGTAFRRLTGEAIVRRRLGDIAGSKAAFEALVSNPDDVAFYQQAQVLAQWGMADKAFAALEAGVKARDSGLVLLKTDQLMNPLHGDRRFGALVARLGLGA